MGWLDELTQRHELPEGAAPAADNFNPQLASRYPLGAFALLQGGDVFEQVNGRPPPGGAERARRYVEQKLRLNPLGASAGLQEHVRRDIGRLLSGSLELVARLEAAKEIAIELIPPGKALSAYGYPKVASAQAAGLFWDDASWERARIALRQEELERIPQLTVHEMAHAIHFLAFTRQERNLIYRVLLPTFRARSAADEAFAIYTERELIEAFTDEDKRAPHVYGFTRQRWSEDHLFTRFVRNLYFPYKPLAGPKLAASFR